MHQLFPRIIAAILWLRARFENITTHKYGRVGIYVCLIALSLIAAHPVYAEQTGFDRFILFLADIALTIAVMLSKLVIIVIEVLLPVMLYNNFSTSPVVSAGWAIVRDTVNMFFVILLIAIAFGTIFGNDKFKWKQQIPSLMTVAIVINFSKTLCGLMIDFGQVIMLTFANAIREIAAGNFVQMFGLGETFALSTSSSILQNASKDSTAEGLQAFDWLFSSVAGVFMMLIVLATMLMLLAILVYRVVMLWVLIVIAPIAWFIGKSGGFIKSNAYTDWWTKFKCLVAIGPVLTFFLWLTLVVAGTGNIAGNAGFVADGAQLSGATVGGAITKIFELNRLISFVISIAMLYAGFEAAQSVCGSAGLGFISKATSGGPTGSAGARALRGVAGLGAKFGAKGARVAGGAAMYGYGKGKELLPPSVSDKLSNVPLLGKTSREDMLRRVAKASGSGIIGKTIGRAATARADKIASERAGKIEAAGKKYKDDSRESKVDQLRRFAESPASTTGGKREAQALLLDAMGDEKSMKELRASGDLEKLWKQHGGSLEKDAKGNKDLMSKLSGFKKQNADLTGATGDIKELKDVVGLSSHALADDKVKARMAEIETTIKKDGGGFYNAREAMEKGLIGNKDQRNVLTKGVGAIYENMNEAELARVPMHALASGATVEMLEKKPDLAYQMISSKDQQVRMALQNRSGDSALSGVLAKSAGLNLGTGAITDGKKFAQTLAQNPALMNMMSAETFDNAMKDEGSLNAFANALSQNEARGAFAAVKSMKSDPNSEATAKLRSRVDAVLTAANNRKDAPQEVQDAHAAFQNHLNVIDKRQVVQPQTLSNDEPSDVTIDVGELNTKEQKATAARDDKTKSIASLQKLKEELDEKMTAMDFDLFEGKQATDEQTQARAQMSAKMKDIDALLEDFEVNREVDPKNVIMQELRATEQAKKEEDEIGAMLDETIKDLNKKIT